MRDMEAVLDHETCPHCGSTDTFWNDSQADPDNDGSSFYMQCDGCGKDYNVRHVYAYTSWEADSED